MIGGVVGMGAVSDFAVAIHRLRVVFENWGLSPPVAIVLEKEWEIRILEGLFVAEIPMVRDTAYEGKSITIAGLQIRVEGQADKHEILAALREPSEAMIAAARRGARTALSEWVSPRIKHPITGARTELLPTHDEVEDTRFLGAWRAMVDETMKP